ncbi:hypothetical protein [Treponema bryantii]|uniref:hypothetical protein n=1 Tax=Treponema bryantii TaxID=163 RepID=UPI0003B33BEF|nr:hypothetical protein [Treponema bryantii]
MLDTTRYLIIWGIISVTVAILSLASYLWLSNVARFENRKKEIGCGMILCTLAVSSLMFLPLLFSRIDLNVLGKELFDSIQFAEFEAEDAGNKLKLVPFIRPFAHFLAATKLKYLMLIIIGAPALVSVLIMIFTIRIIFLIREPKLENENTSNRKHLFEYNPEIVTDLNKSK